MNFTTHKLAKMLELSPGDIICIKDPRLGCDKLCNYYSVTKGLTLKPQSIQSSLINVYNMKDLIDVTFEVVKPKKINLGHLKLKQVNGEIIHKNNLQVISAYMCIYNKNEESMEKKLYDVLCDWHNKDYLDYEIYQILKTRLDRGEVEVDGEYFETVN